MSLAPYVRIVARGQGRARPLTLDEAYQAMTVILQGEADAEAIGGLLMVLRLRGEVPEEIAGFTAALRDFVHDKLPPADLDWPSYAAGRSRGAPLFLLSARLVAQVGLSVSMHGWNSHQSPVASVRDALNIAGPQVRYDRLEDLCPQGFELLALRDKLGLRSCINTVLRMWNPSRARATVQGVFHPSYRSLQAEAAAVLGQKDLSIIKGGGGEFERHPSKSITVFGLRGGTHIQEPFAPLIDDTRRLHEEDAPVDPAALWRGTVEDAFAEATVIGTAALALWTLTPEASAADVHAQAQKLWAQRDENESVAA